MRTNPLLIRVVLGASVVLAAGIALSTPYVNEDLFLAFAAGRDIAHGLVAGPDTASFTAEGKIWVNQAWLSHYLLYLAHESLGPSGPVAIKVVLFSCCLLLILFRCSRLGAGVESAFVAIIPALLASGTFLGIRGENFGLLFFILFTTLLTIEPLLKYWRRLAIPLTIAAWANFHGSFMLGLGLLYVKCLLVAWRRFRTGSPAKLEMAEWFFVASVSTVLPGVFSPFGMENLLMPFRQIGTSSVTQYSADWLPLWSFSEIHNGFLGGGSVYPFLILLGILVAFAIMAVMTKTSLSAPHMSADWKMEAIVAVVTVIMAFRFRRLVLFAALSVVPILSLLIQAAANHFRAEQLDSARPVTRAGSSAVAGVGAAVACLFLMLALFWRAAVVPYLPGNPFRSERPLVRELMSFDSFSSDVVGFIRTNGIGETNAGERFLAGWTVSSYLMYAMPQIKLFMDTRDQSFYPPQVVTDYFTIMGLISPKGPGPLELLDNYGVTCIVLTTEVIDFHAAVKLMSSKRWACLYADTKGLVLVRPDSARFGQAVNSGLSGLWFPDEESKTLSRALLSHYMFGRIEPEVVEELKAVVKRDPWPNYYPLLVWGMDQAGSSCFKQGTVDFLVSEALRLDRAEQSSDIPDARAMESLVKIYGILEQNAAKCGQLEIGLRFKTLKDSAQNSRDRLRDKFLGRFL